MMSKYHSGEHSTPINIYGAAYQRHAKAENNAMALKTQYQIECENGAN